MARELVVNYAPYHRSPVKPRSFQDFCAMYDTQGKITGLWSFALQNPKTGEITKELWTPNVVTDQGAVNVLQASINSAVPAAVFNNILITNNSGSTTLNAALNSGTTYASMTVVALPAAIPSGSTIQTGYGTGTTQNWVLSGAAAQSATIVNVTSQIASATFGIGSAVVPVPQVTDNPTNAALTSNQSTPLSQYSGNLAGGAFTFNATTGAGNRNVVVTFTFKTAANGGTTSIGNYTDAWLVNVATGATTNNYVCHEINSPMRCDNSNNIVVTVTLKL